MAGIEILKEQVSTDTPVLLFRCTLTNGAVEYWSQYRVSHGGNTYDSRVIGHSGFEMRAASEDGIDGASRVSLLLANTDSRFSQIDRGIGFKGARLQVSFAFADLAGGILTTAAWPIFQGLADAPSESLEGSLRINFTNRLALHRVALPRVRIQRRCPWTFPSSGTARAEAVNGGEMGRYSIMFACGYSPDQPAGVGNRTNGEVFTTCEYTRASCEARGMFDRDENGRPTARFGGIQFVPATSLVRGVGESGYRQSTAQENSTRYNDAVPLLYGTVWYQPPVVFAKNDGNLSRVEVLLSAGPIQGVLKVLVSGIEVPLGIAGRDMTGTGWFNVVSLGERNGGFNLNFTDATGRALGDPYGSMAVLSVVVPNRISNGRTVPKVEVLAQGLRLAQYDVTGTFERESFTNNPAWVLLDVLRRSGWELGELDVPSFRRAAEHCAETVPAKDANGASVQIPRYQCNLLIQRRTSAADVVRGIRSGARLMLTYSPGGLLQLRVEGTLAEQQNERRPTSNGTSPVAGGWPAYEFGDGTYGLGGILRRSDGTPSFRLFSRTTAESPNRVSIEFQDEFNGYQQDSFSLVDTEDASLVKQEVTTSLPALGVANLDQAARLCRTYLHRSLFGNLYAEFDTSMRGVGVWPGDIISVTYRKEGLDRDLFRVIKVAPHQNFGVVTIVAQVHDDDWYVPGASREQAARRRLSGIVSLPRPLGGKRINDEGQPEFSIREEVSGGGDGGVVIELLTEFTPPPRSVSSGVGPPQVSLSPSIISSGGTLRGPDTLYYALAGADSNGAEGELSFVVRAEVPSGPSFQVVLQDLSFPPGTESFTVYRGRSPIELRQLRSSVPLSRTFTDRGDIDAGHDSPPDSSYSHANFYWRKELVPPTMATTAGARRIGSSSLELTPDEFLGAMVTVLSGRGRGQERRVTAHDSSVFTVEPAWVVVPDSTSVFAVADPTWQFAGMTRTDRIRIAVSNHPGAVVQVLGLSANALDQECPAEISIITRHSIAGGAGNLLDNDLPPVPTFGASVDGKGSVVVGGIGFGTLQNTRSITALTSILHYWNEWTGPSQLRLGSSALVDHEILVLTPPTAVAGGAVVQIGSEVMQVTGVLDAGARWSVRRGVLGSVASGHSATEVIYRLDKRVAILPVARDFFGSPASGSWTHSIDLPASRLVAAELFATNSRGNGPAAERSFAATALRGLRTLQGGQTTLHASGPVAIGSAVTPTAIVGEAKVVRDIVATLGEPTTAGPLIVDVRISSGWSVSLTIEAGETTSDVLSGADWPSIPEFAEITVDVISVPPSGSGSPGRDLTIIIRH